MVSLEWSFNGPGKRLLSILTPGSLPMRLTGSECGVASHEAHLPPRGHPQDDIDTMLST